MSLAPPSSLAALAEVPRSSWRLFLPLAVMMFLQCALRAVWIPYIPNYLSTAANAGGLGFTNGQVGWIMGLAASLGAITAPLVAGQVADRYLNAERALALLVLIGGAAMWGMAGASTFPLFLGLSLVLSVAYNPTQALTNGLCFHNLPHPERQYPPLRMWGTIGWVVASSLFPLLWLNTGSATTNTHRIADALKLAAAGSVLYAIFCIRFLPRTPPAAQARAGRSLALSGALRLLRHRGFLAVILAGLLISMVNQVYVFRMSPFLKNQVGLADRWIGGAMAVGQASEVFFIAFLGLLLSRWGYRRVLVVGLAAYLLRYLIFAATGSLGWILTAQALHGPCFACFFAAAYLYVDRIAPPDARHSAQTLLNLVTLGVGPILAGFANQYFDRFTAARLVGGAVVQSQQYGPVWWTMAAAAAVALGALGVLFPRQRAEVSR